MRSLAVATLVLSLGDSVLAEPASRAIRHSDIVFMYDSASMYEPYGCTVLGWAGWANAERVQTAHDKGVRQFTCSVGFLTEFKNVIDFDPDFLDAACRNFAGEPFVVPWLTDHIHMGRPAYWWCTNSPLYRRYLNTRLEQVMKVAPDGLHIDDYRGTSGSVTWLNGCFCKHCMAAFRSYLMEHAPGERLKALGIKDLTTFDYRQFLLDRGVKPEGYKKQRPKLPLAEAFHHFQVMANNAFVAEYRKRAEALRGKPLTLCVNSGLSNPHALVIAPQLSYFCCEVRHDASKRRTAKHPAYVYRLADGLDRPVASTAGGWDWAYVKEHNLPGLARTWIAMSYAFGHNLMAPHRQWCYTKKKGTHWYDGPTEQYAYMYRFVREHARLFDDYEAVAPVAVLYSNAARRQGRGNIEPICIALAEHNVPFTVVVAGDAWLDYRLDPKRLATFRTVIKPPVDLALDMRQQKALDTVAKQGRLITWPADKKPPEDLRKWITVEGSNDVWVLPRTAPGRKNAPTVVHVLNRSYDPSKDACVPQTKFRIRLANDLLGDRAFRKATLYAPKTAPVELALTPDPNAVVLTVPELGTWGVVELVP